MRMVFFVLSILLGIAFVSSCNDKDPIKDPELYVNWRLDSISQIGGGGTVTKDFFATDTISFLDGANIIVTFNDDFQVGATYNGIIGGGTYSLQDHNGLTIENFARGDESGLESEWFNALISGINDAESYSIVNTKLSIFYQVNTRQLHFTKL